MANNGSQAAHKALKSTRVLKPLTDIIKPVTVNSKPELAKPQPMPEAPAAIPAKVKLLISLEQKGVARNAAEKIAELKLVRENINSLTKVEKEIKQEVIPFVSEYPTVLAWKQNSDTEKIDWKKVATYFFEAGNFDKQIYTEVVSQNTEVKEGAKSLLILV